MMSGETAYQNVMRRRAELRQELDELETFLRLYARYAGASSELTEKPRTESAPQPLPKQAKSGTSSVPHDVIRSIILERGRPLKRGALARALADAGQPVRGKNPSNYVGTVMWRAKDEFVNMEGHGYWPRDVAYAPAGYEPGQEAASGEQSPEQDESDLWGGGRSAA